MDTLIKRKTYLSGVIFLVIISKLLLNTNNMITQSIGIILLPLLVVKVIKAMVCDQEKGIN